MKKTNASHKSSELNSVLRSHFQAKINLARIKLISHVIIALCKVKTVTFKQLANAFESFVDAKPSLRRIRLYLRFKSDSSADFQATSQTRATDIEYWQNQLEVWTDR